MKPVNSAQIAKIHVLLNQMNLTDQKKDFVIEFSNGRVTSTKDLSFYEASTLLQHLSKFDPKDRMRRKVFALAYEAGIIYGDTPADKKINVAKLNMFLRERGTVKKEINEMNNGELVKVVSQFQQISKHSDQTSANKATKSLLASLKIPVAKKA